MRERIVILDFQDVISKGGKDVISRHKMYADKLDEVTNKGLSLIIITTSELNFLQPDERELFMRLGSRKLSYLGNILALRKFLSSAQDIRLIVAGDVFKAGPQALLSQFFIKKKIPIQFQVHADMAAKGWASYSFIHSVKFLVGVIVLRNAKYVRAVSKRQSKNLRKVTRNGTVIQVVPVPLNIPKSLIQNSKFHNPFSVGILGRVQKDRGIPLLEQFVKELAKENLRVNFVIAGIGPDDSTMNEIQHRLSNIADFKNLGFLSSDELNTFWNETDLLLSLAPFESYGRSMREAVNLGIRVISTPNSGALDLLEEVGSEWISLWSPGQVLNAGNLVRKISALEKGGSGPTSNGVIGSEIDLLVQSWRDCI